MGKMSVSDLKSKNRSFDNVLDSYLNLVDGGNLSGNVTLGDASADSHTVNGKLVSKDGVHLKNTAAAGIGPSDLIIGKGGSSLASADPFTQSATALFPLGTKLQYGDRTFRYGFSGEANNAGVLLEGAALVNAHHRDIAVQAAAAVGATSIAVTLGATATTLNQYADGYIHINDDTADANSQGKLLRIKSNAAADASATATMVTYDPIDVILPTTAKADLIKNPYVDVVKTATTPVNTVLGVTPIEIADNRYFWIQTGGPASVLCVDAAPTIGEPVTRNTATAGSVQATAAGADDLNDNIGRCMVTNGVSDNIVVMLNLDW